MKRLPFALLLVLAPGLLGLAALFAGGTLAWWMLPLGVAAAWLLARPRPPQWLRPRAWSSGDRALAVFVLAGAAAIAWGSVATSDRSWDGYTTWSLTARHLMHGEGLGGAYFADPQVYAWGRGYPLLQPTLVALLGQCLGPTAARLWFPCAWLLLLSAVAGAVRAAGPPARVRLAVAGIALLPIFLEPGDGSAESGFADLLTAALVAFAVQGILADAALLAASAAAALVLTKTEGTLHAALWLGVAAAAGRRRAAIGAATGTLLAMATWMPVRHALLTPGSATPMTLNGFAPCALPLVALVAGGACRRWGRWALFAGLALVLVPGLPGAAVASATGFSLPHPEWAALPGAVGQVAVQLGWLRRFGATFLVLAVLTAVTWRNRREAPRAWQLGAPLAAGVGVFALAIAGFLLLMPAPHRALFFGEGIGRYLSQVAGVAWVAIGVFLSADPLPPRTQPRTAV